MRSASGRHDLTSDLYDVLGYDHEEKKVRIGALAENTHPQIRDMIVDMLQSRVGFTPSEAKLVVKECWLDTPETLEIKQVTVNVPLVYKDNVTLNAVF